MPVMTRLIAEGVLLIEEAYHLVFIVILAAVFFRITLVIIRLLRGALISQRRSWFGVLKHLHELPVLAASLPVAVGIMSARRGVRMRDVVAYTSVIDDNGEVNASAGTVEHPVRPARYPLLLR